MLARPVYVKPEGMALMQTVRRALLPAGLLLIQVGCGAARPQSTALPAAPEAALDSVPLSEAPALPQDEALVAGEAPESLIALGRVSDPGSFVNRVLELGMPGLRWEALAEERLPGFNAAFDAAGTVELALTLRGAPKRPVYEAAFSLPIKDATQLLALAEGPARQPVTQISSSRHQVGATCVLGPALGAAPYRFVCGMERLPSPELEAYLRAGLPLQTLPKEDGYFELRAATLSAFYLETVLAELRKMASQTLDNPGLDLLRTNALAALKNNAEAIEALSFTYGLRDKVLSGEAGMRLHKGHDAFLSNYAASSARVQGAIPKAFWQLPADALVANASLADTEASVLIEAIKPSVTTLATLLDLPPATLKALETWLDAAAKRPTSVSSISVHDAPGKEAPAGLTPENPGLYLLYWASRLEGISLMETPFEQTRAQLDTLLGLIKDKGTRNFVGRFVDAKTLRSYWPKLRTRKLSKRDRLSSSDLLYEITLPTKLGKALQPEGLNKADAKRTQSWLKRSAPKRLYVALLKSGSHTVVGLDTDRKRLLEAARKTAEGELEATLGDLPEARQLAARQGIGWAWQRLGQVLALSTEALRETLGDKVGEVPEVTLDERAWLYVAPEKRKLSARVRVELDMQDVAKLVGLIGRLGAP